MEVSLENERKFRAVKVPLSKLENGVEITQGYLSIDPPIRVRVEDFEDCYLTIKEKIAPAVNLEFIQEIAISVANKLMPFHKYHKIRKTRYRIGRAEIDVFCAELTGLVLIEFEQEFPGEEFELPINFLVEEVTGDERFENQNLCQLDGLPEEWRCHDVSGSL